MDLSIITVNWNVRDLLIKCLESIFKQTKDLTYEVIVVDNASNDNSVSELRKIFSHEILAEKLVLIASDKNLGFSKGNNLGLKEARGEYLLFMNPDMEFTENSAFKLKTVFEKNENVGIVTGNLFYGDGVLQPNIKRNPDFCSQLLIELKLHRLFKFSPCLKRYLAKDFDYTKEQEVEQAMGALIFMKKSVMEKLGGWDEDYWIWWEDLDLCKRIQNLGYKIIYSPTTKVTHYEGRSFGQVQTLEKQKRFVKAMLTYFKKHHSRRAYFILKIFSPVSLFLAYITQILKIKAKTQSKI